MTIEELIQKIHLTLDSPVNPKLTGDKLASLLIEIVNGLASIQQVSSFIPIAENQYGSHPEFLSQEALNIYLLRKSSEQASKGTFNLQDPTILTDTTVLLNQSINL